jgi:hypothetical protein
VPNTAVRRCGAKFEHQIGTIHSIHCFESLESAYPAEWHAVRGIQECSVKYAPEFTIGLRFTHSVHASDRDIAFPILTDSLKNQLGRLGQIDRGNADSENI